MNNFIRIPGTEIDVKCPLMNLYQDAKLAALIPETIVLLREQKMKQGITELQISAAALEALLSVDTKLLLKVLATIVVKSDRVFWVPECESENMEFVGLITNDMLITLKEGKIVPGVLVENFLRNNIGWAAPIIDLMTSWIARKKSLNPKDTKDSEIRSGIPPTT